MTARPRGVRRGAAIPASVVLLAGCVATSSPGAPGSASVSASPPDGRSPTAPSRWRPEVGQSWQWQLSGELDLGVEADIYDLDWQTTPAETVEELHDAGRRVVCYVSVGTWEAFRPDAQAFPEVVRGERLDDWPDEQWLDVRRLDVVGPPLLARFDVCAAKGFDAVEPDNVDAYANDSGFALTAADQLAFNRWVAAAAHARGLGVGLKNDLAQVPELVGDFDFAVNEECLAYDECDRLLPFLDAGKAVLHAEYHVPADRLCQAPSGFASILKRLELDAGRVTCPS